MKKQLSLYSLIGILNTLIHWGLFAALIEWGLSQSLSNFFGFLVAATFSYVLNSHYTFQTIPNKKSYFLFMAGMGFVSLLVGFLGDYFHWYGIVTLVLFSLISWIMGFLWSHYFVFKK